MMRSSTSCTAPDNAQSLNGLNKDWRINYVFRRRINSRATEAAAACTYCTGTTAATGTSTTAGTSPEG
jgi:hypothetical protein